MLMSQMWDEYVIVVYAFPIESKMKNGFDRALSCQWVRDDSRNLNNELMEIQIYSINK